MANVTDAQDEWVRRVLRFETAATQATSTDELLVPKGTVAYRSALLGFAKAKSRVTDQLNALRAAIVVELPEEADLAKLLQFELSGLNAEIGDAVDDAINASGGDRQEAETKTRTLLEGYVARLANYPLVDHVDANPFVTVDIRRTLTTALNDIIAHMP
jgi:hypothetical protein